MKLYNLTMKINRMEMLKAKIGLELGNGYQEIEDYMGEALTETTMKEIERHAGILGKTVGDNQDDAGDIVDASFHNATWSERIWANQDRLKYDLGKLLTSGLIQGKNPRELARDLQKSMNVSKYDAERLMRTEMCRVQIDASLREIEANGFTQFIFIADSGGSRTCEQCRALDGKTFSLKDGKIGVNLPPIHPNCRCSIAGHEDDEDFISWLENHGVELTDDDLKAMGLSRGDTQERERAPIKDTGLAVPGHVNAKLVNSKEYHDKFENLTGSKLVDEALYKECLKLLADNNDTEFEHIVAIDARTGAILEKNTATAEAGKTYACGFSPRQTQTLSSRDGMFEGIHNHPNSSVPSRDDIQKLFERPKQIASTVCCHDGTVHRLEKIKDFTEIDELVKTVYHETKMIYQRYGKEKIEYECTMQLIDILEKEGYVKYDKR